MRRISVIVLCAAAVLIALSGCGKENGENSVVPTENSTATENKLPQENAAENATEKPIESGSMPDVFSVLESCRISGMPGNYRFTFDHPQVPEAFHLEVSFSIYKDGPEGDLEIANYKSDGSWLARPSDYNPVKRKVNVPIDLSESLSDKYVMVAVKCFGKGFETESAVAIHDYDGTVSDGTEAVFGWSR